MDEALRKLLEQSAAIKAAPIPFTLAVVAIAGLVWFVVNWAYSAIRSSKNALNSSDMRCQNCSKMCGYAYKRSHVVAGGERD